MTWRELGDQQAHGSYPLPLQMVTPVWPPGQVQLRRDPMLQGPDGERDPHTQDPSLPLGEQSFPPACPSAHVHGVLLPGVHELGAAHWHDDHPTAALQCCTPLLPSPQVQTVVVSGG